MIYAVFQLHLKENYIYFQSYLSSWIYSVQDSLNVLSGLTELSEILLDFLLSAFSSQTAIMMI